MGWDFLWGDEGSSYDAGLRAMRAAVRSWDGRIKETIFESSVPEKAGAKSMEDFITKVYGVLADR